MLSLKSHPEGWIVKIQVQPRAAQNAVAGTHGDALKLRLTAPPVEGAANKACVAFLAKQLGLPKSALTIVTGRASRTKQLLVRPKNEPATKETLARLKHQIEALAQTE